ncbi:MAG: 50S ribosomal protein L15 [Neisseriaceae bacterium]
MHLNTIAPGENSKKSPKRVGRGIGSGLGKTCGRGHKGQKSRAGGYHKVGFEGGQMPIQRRIPKRGFKSCKKKLNGEVTLKQLNQLAVSVVDLSVLKEAGFLGSGVRYVKVIATGAVEKSYHLKGLSATTSARKTIEAAGGSVAVLTKG